MNLQNTAKFSSYNNHPYRTKETFNDSNFLKKIDIRVLQKSFFGKKCESSLRW